MRAVFYFFFARAARQSRKSLSACLRPRAACSCGSIGGLRRGHCPGEEGIVGHGCPPRDTLRGVVDEAESATGIDLSHLSDDLSAREELIVPVMPAHMPQVQGDVAGAVAPVADEPHTFGVMIPSVNARSLTQHAFSLEVQDWTCLCAFWRCLLSHFFLPCCDPPLYMAPCLEVDVNNKPVDK
ncbi:MAG TPA: hypothetical protein DCS29_04810 [Candidatus Magasanikbacteria bacterium]|nr:MAG: hypothetical protein A2479_03945 [Candidatus Magasanikbacteria bacterium RIFOXYC2_FULL_39_8]HAT04054.1 hypothetical protein [Candidatus Magasanikbacteria bacterium]